jgi:hypothetical protein
MLPRSWRDKATVFVVRLKMGGHVPNREPPFSRSDAQLEIIECVRCKAYWRLIHAVRGDYSPGQCRGHDDPS